MRVLSACFRIASGLPCAAPTTPVTAQNRDFLAGMFWPRIHQVNVAGSVVETKVGVTLGRRSTCYLFDTKGCEYRNAAPMLE